MYTSKIWVLILIILEVTLWDCDQYVARDLRLTVLILIILEVTLWVRMRQEMLAFVSLNPYYTGSYSMSEMQFTLC